MYISIYLQTVCSGFSILALTLSPPLLRLPSNHPSLSVGGKSLPGYTYPAVQAPPVSLCSPHLWAILALFILPRLLSQHESHATFPPGRSWLEWHRIQVANLKMHTRCLLQTSHCTLHSLIMCCTIFVPPALWWALMATSMKAEVGTTSGDTQEATMTLGMACQSSVTTPPPCRLATPWICCAIV